MTTKAQELANDFTGCTALLMDELCDEQEGVTLMLSDDCKVKTWIFTDFSAIQVTEDLYWKVMAY